MSPQQGRRPLQSHTKHSIGKKSSVQVNPGSVVGFPESGDSNHCLGTQMFLDLMDSPASMRNGQVKAIRREVEGFIRQL